MPSASVARRDDDVIERERGRSAHSVTRPSTQTTVSPPTQMSSPIAIDVDAAGATDRGALRSRHSAAGAMPAPISHCARLAFRLPVTGSSGTPSVGDEGADLELRRLVGRDAGPRRDDADLAGRASPRSRARAPAPRRASRAARRPSRAVVDPLRGLDRRGLDAQAADQLRQHRRLDVAAAPQRRRRERQALAVAPDPHQADAALLDDVGAARPAAGGQPRVAAAERRMAGERQLALGREDAHPVVGLGDRSARSRNVVSLRFVQRANACMRAASSASAPWTTASGLPSSGVSVKTSTWVKAKRLSCGFLQHARQRGDAVVDQRRRRR